MPSGHARTTIQGFEHVVPLFGGSLHYMPQFIHIVLTRIALGTNFAISFSVIGSTRRRLGAPRHERRSSGNLVEE
jgi:hypothetical protein